MKKMRVGVIGCGVISEIYLKNMTEVFKNLEVVAVCDILKDRAQARAEQFGIPYAYDDAEEMLKRDDIDIAVILTIPSQHVSNCKMALNAGKHVYMEKPLALNREEGKELLCLAEEKGLFVTCAPDILMGSCVQTTKTVIESGEIGKPFGSIAIRINGGPEWWHPDPAFLYQKGAGPIYDVGPYYIAGLTYLLGPVESVQCMCTKAFEQRMITSQPKYGQMMEVEVPTNITAQLKHSSGAISTLVLSWDVAATNHRDHDIEIYGPKGSMMLPTFGQFSGEILLRKKGEAEWENVPDLYPYTDNSRGIGVADLASAIVNDRKPRLSAELAYHVLDVLNSIDEAGVDGQTHRVESTYDVFSSLPRGLVLGEID